MVPDPGGDLLRKLHDNPQGLERKTAHQRLPDRDSLADLDVPLGHDTCVRRPDERVLELLFRRLDSRAGGVDACHGRIPRGQRLVVFPPGTRARFEQALGTLEFGDRLLLARERRLEVRFCLSQRSLLLDVREAHDRFAGLDIVVDVVKELGDTARGLRGHRRLVDGFDGAVVDALERRARHFGDRGFERQFFGRGIRCCQ